MNDRIAELWAAQCDGIRDRMIDDLTQALFADGVGAAPRRPLTWRDRVRRRWERTQRYAVTLWRALNGDDPYDVEDD